MTLEHTFTSYAQLTDIQTDVTGAETSTLTETDYSETDNGDGTYDYNATYEESTTGDYTFTLTTAETSAGETATWGSQSYTISVSAVPESVTEDWERSDPLVDYTDTASVKDETTVVTSTVWEGLYGIEFTGTGAYPDNIYVTDSTPLPGRLPTKGDAFGTLSYLDEASSESQVYFLFGVESGDTHYAPRYGPRGDNLSMYKSVNGSLTQVMNTPFSNWRQGWYYMIIRWHDANTSEPDNTIELELYEMDPANDTISNPGQMVASVSDTDSDVAGTGIGWSENHSSVQTHYADYYHIRGDADT